MKNLEKLLNALAATVAAIPGIAVVWAGVGAPPGYKLMFGLIIEAFGALTLLIAYLNRGRLQKQKREVVTKWSIRLGGVAICLLLLYLFVFSLCVVSHPIRGTVYYPLYLTGKAKQLVQDAGSRKEAIERNGRGGMEAVVRQMPEIYLVLTTITLLVVFTLQVIALTLAFGLAGFAVRLSKNKNGPP